MNVKTGDLAIVVVPSDWSYSRMLHGKVVDVVRPMPTYLSQGFRPLWWCRFHEAWATPSGLVVTEHEMLDSWLRPISSREVAIEMADRFSSPNVLKLTEVGSIDPVNALRADGLHEVVKENA